MGLKFGRDYTFKKLAMIFKTPSIEFYVIQSVSFLCLQKNLNFANVSLVFILFQLLNLKCLVPASYR